MRVEDLLRRSARSDRAKTAIVSDGARLSYGDLDAQASALAANLVARGIARGDRVLVLMENIPEAAVAIYGILKAGAIFCPVNPAVREEGLRFLIEDSEPRAVLTQAKFATRCKAAVADATSGPMVIAARGDALLPGDVARFEEFLVPSNAAKGEAGTDDDLAMIIYTSGSTGRQKGVMMSHASMDFASGAIASYLGSRADDVVLSALPLSFTYGLYQLLVTVRTGATLVLQKSFAFPVEVLEVARAEGATGLPLVPTMATLLLSMKDMNPDALPSLRTITNAAAALPPAHVERLKGLFPRARLFSMYGLTECARATYLAPEEIERRPSSVGKALPGTKVAIVDEAGEPVAPGETGELVVHGPHVMRGYWRNAAATSLALRQDAGSGEIWLHTGDLFFADGDGFLHFLGRKDDMLKVRGEKVAPRQVEAVLHECPGVAEAVVIGLPDAVAGNRLHAIVVPSLPTLTEREVVRHCAGRLPDVMVPKSVEFRAELPKTVSGKVVRRLVA